MSVTINFNDTIENGKRVSYDSMKQNLSNLICSKISGLNMTQMVAATTLSTDQPKVSQLMNGKVHGFSVKRLCDFVELLGGTVVLNIKDVEGAIIKCMDKVNDNIDVIKSTLCTILIEKMDNMCITQAMLAEMLGIDQPKVSQMKNGNTAGFSMERLCSFVSVVGYTVDMSIAFPE